jgi:hypothetical protein
MFPFIQCHHTSGRALWGGFSNPLFRGSASARVAGTEVCARPAFAHNVMKRRRLAAAGVAGILLKRKYIPEIIMVPDLFPIA